MTRVGNSETYNKNLHNDDTSKFTGALDLTGKLHYALRSLWWTCFEENVKVLCETYEYTTKVKLDRYGPTNKFAHQVLL